MSNMVTLNTGHTTNSLTTTSNNIPTEIISYIFLIATVAHNFQDRLGSILQLITISHVSSRWREVAISTRTLWTYVILTFPISPSQLLRSQIWLSRSYPLPIDIFLDFRDPSWGWEEDSDSVGFPLELMVPILRFLLADVKRWRHFELLTDTWAPIFTFLRDTRDVEAAPLLRSISLSRCNAYFASKGAVFQPVQFRDPIPLFGGLALDALRDVSLVGVHVDWAQSSLRNLTSLTFKYQASGVMPSLDQFIDILSGCPELRHLCIVGWGPQFEKPTVQEIWDPSPKFIHLRHLIDFYFGFVDVDYALKVLSLFHFPSVQSLALEDVSFTLHPELEHENATPILDWLTSNDSELSDVSTLAAIPRTACGISLNGILSLRLDSIHGNVPAFSRFFSALTNLQKLDLLNMESFALETLHPSSDPCHHHPCPNLTDLECRNVDPTALVDLVGLREIKEIPLKSILFESHNPLSQDDFDNLDRVGVRVEMSEMETFEC